jgi:hypothetical protein
MRQANGQAPSSKALVKGLAKELEIDEGLLEKLAADVWKDLRQAVYVLLVPVAPQRT